METNHIVIEDMGYAGYGAASFMRRFAGGFVDLLLTFGIAYLIPILGPLLSIAYFLNKDAFPFLKGQSIGKKIFHIKVIKQSDHKAIVKDYSSSIFRAVTLLIPILNMLELVLTLLNKERLGDRWAGTLVIKI